MQDELNTAVLRPQLVLVIRSVPRLAWSRSSGGTERILQSHLILVVRFWSWPSPSTVRLQLVPSRLPTVLQSQLIHRSSELALRCPPAIGVGTTSSVGAGRVAGVDRPDLSPRRCRTFARCYCGSDWRKVISAGTRLFGVGVPQLSGGSEIR